MSGGPATPPEGLPLSAAEIYELNRAWHRLLPWPDSVSGLRIGYVMRPLEHGPGHPLPETTDGEFEPGPTARRVDRRFKG